MRRFWRVWLVLSVVVVAQANEETLSVYRKLLGALVPKKIVRVYVEEPKLKAILKHSRKLQVVDDPFRADTAVLDRREAYLDLKQRALREGKRLPLLVARRFRLFRDYEEFVAAFYWKKGRKQFLFLSSRLKRYGIVLTPDFEYFIVDRL